MPPTYLSDEIGADADSIYVTLGGEKIVISTGWQQVEGILSQPSYWHVTMGWGDIAAPLILKYPKGTPFELFVGGQRQATGRTDGPESTMTPGGGTTVTVRGRDILAKLHDTYVAASVPINVGTYADLVWYALRKCALVQTDAIDPNVLRTDNAANRAIKSGVPIQSILPHRTVQRILDNEGATTATVGSTASYPQARIGETWLGFIRRYLDRAGLMLWSAADGTFVLSAPDGNQAASYTIRRRSGEPTGGGNIVGHHFSDLGTHRHTEAILYGRGGGRILGRAKARGAFEDQEMMDAGYGDQPIVLHDTHVHSDAEAEFLARRMLAEERRGGYVLQYTISGLTLPYTPSGGRDRAVVVPDTVIEVEDDLLGISGNFYVEQVTRARSPETTCTIRLMRVEDLIFGAPDEA